MHNIVKILLFLPVLFCLHPSAQTEHSPASFVSSDIDRLRRVIMLTPGDEMRRMTLLANEDHPSFAADAMQTAAIEQHRAFVKLLQSMTVEVLELDKLINSALEAARRKGELDSWLRMNLPSFKFQAKDLDQLDAASLIGRGNFFYHYDDQARFSPVLLPYKWMFYTRDIGVMTPGGLILTHFANYDRAGETGFLEFAWRFAPELSKYPIVYNSPAEGVLVQGGDTIVLDPRTLLLGVGNLTEGRVAERLAKALNMDVLAVSMPPLDPVNKGYSGWTGVHSQFLHLDTFFTLVDTKKALAVPYMLEARYAQENPVVRLIEDLDRSVMSVQQQDPVRHKSRYGSVPISRKALEAIGWVTHYEAGTGRSNLLKKKLVDVMRERGYTIIPVGGAQGSLKIEQYLLERVLFELNFQAANVVAIEPGVVVAYAENKYTIEALRAAGVKVLTIDGSYLAMWHGGPHCLTLPLERAN